MLNRPRLCRLCGLIVLILLATTAAWADSLALVTSQAGQAANDAVNWSQLGADATTLGSDFNATSGKGVTVTGSLTGPNSLVSVVCAASPCSWAGSGFTAGDSLVWTSDAGNGGNGPATLNLGTSVAGVGALIQANAPGQFVAQIQVFNGATSLGSFTVTSDANGDAVYIGVQDQTGANITKVVFSLTNCGPDDSSGCADFALDTVNLNTGSLAGVSNTAVASSLSPSTYGQSVTFTATVSSTSGTPTGTVSFQDGGITIGGAPLVSGLASLTTAALSAGSHSITVVYGGDSNFKGSTSAPLTQTVKQATSTMALGSSVNPSMFDQPATFTATITPGFGGVATGSVSFFNGGALMGTTTVTGNSASFTAATLSVGSHGIQATYSGDSNVVNSISAIVTQHVNKATTTTVATSSLNPSRVGQSVNFTATVTPKFGGTATGTVTFKQGTTVLGIGTLSGGSTSFSTSSLAAGSGTITAAYGGDGNFLSSSGSVIQKVNKYATTTTVTSSSNPSTFGQMVTFTATVSSTGGTPPDGEVVAFKNGSAVLGTGTLSVGKASFMTSSLSAGSHSITAVYGADATFGGSTSLALTQKVNKIATLTTVISGLNPSTFGQTVTFTATVGSGAGAPPDGEIVTFKNGTTTLGTGTLSGGSTSFSISSLNAGLRSITASYAGDTTLASSSGSVTQTINSASTSLALTSSQNPSGVGQSVTFTAVVSSSGGTPSGTVSFKQGSTVLGTGTLDASGTATFSTNSVAAGSDVITASYGASSNFGGSSASLTQVVQ